MSKARPIVVLLLPACIAVAAWFWFSSEPSTLPVEQGVPLAEYEAEAQGRSKDTNPSPFSVSDGLTEVPVDSSIETAIETPAIAAPLPLNTTIELPPIDVTAVAQSPINDAEFRMLRSRLQSDPDLLQQFIDEFRQEQNPERLARLVQLLGDVGGEAVTLLASELIYSGDTATRKQGLSLLQRVQPGNEYARDIASGLLATEVEPQILVSTLNSLSTPGAVDEQSRQFLADQVAYLSDHEDASVRSISMNILSRWTTDDRYTSILLSGLNDSELIVRETAAYAMVGHEDSSEQVVNTLMSLALDTDAEKSVRSAVLLALRGMGIDDQQRQQLLDAERLMNRVPRGNR